MTPDLPPGFQIIDNAVQDCPQIIDWLDQHSSFEASRVVNADISTGRTSTTAAVNFLDFNNPPFIHAMNKAVYHAIDAYACHYEFQFTSVENVSVQRYEVGQHYAVHHDAGVGIPRVVSALVYLNTVEEGGETHFPLFDVTIKPIEGRLAIFPAAYPYAHAALPPKKGVKYAAAFWARQ